MPKTSQLFVVKNTTSGGCIFGCFEVETNTRQDDTETTLLNPVRGRFKRGTLYQQRSENKGEYEGENCVRIFARINAQKVERKNAQLDTLTGDPLLPLPTTTAGPSRRALLPIRSPYQPARPRHAAPRARRGLNVPRGAQGYRPDTKRAPRPLSVRVGGCNP
jgi:hypothetical protein